MISTQELSDCVFYMAVCQICKAARREQPSTTLSRKSEKMKAQFLAKLLSTGCLLTFLSQCAAVLPDKSVKSQKAISTTLTMDEIARLVRQLGDNSFSARESASEQLDCIGKQALPDLRLHFPGNSYT